MPSSMDHGCRLTKWREEGVNTEHEESVRQQILDGLIADKGGDQQISTVTQDSSRGHRQRRL